LAEVTVGDHEFKIIQQEYKTEALQIIEFKVGGSTLTIDNQGITLQVAQGGSPTGPYAGSVKIDQKGVTVEGMTITLKGQTQVELKGAIVQVNGDGMLKLKGGILMLN
jgi:type VI secretion system secreted protein VgrG